MLAIIVHNIYSNVRLNEFIDVTLAFPEVDVIVVSKASSVAAQSGVPEAEKKAFLRNRRFLYLPDLNDSVEILNLSKLYLLVPTKLAIMSVDFKAFKEEVLKNRIGIAISGSDSSFTAKEMELGVPVDIGIDEFLPPSAYAAIFLYNLFKRI